MNEFFKAERKRKDAMSFMQKSRQADYRAAFSREI